jgi:hypothetical protein
LTEDAIRRLLDINDRLADFNIQEFNDQVERAKRGMVEKDYLRPITLPPDIGAAPTAAKPIEEMTEAEVDAELKALEEANAR